MDDNVDAKVFVYQHLWGTGSFSSTMDCIDDHQSYRRARFWSLDGQFLDNVDPEWIFFQREQDIKKRLYKRYMDKARQQQELYSADSAPLETEPSLQQKSYYAKAKISEQVGRAVQESPQALAATRFDWLEVQRSFNKGPPQAMTTVVANAHTSEIEAHALNGPCAAPCAEHTVLSMSRRKPFGYKLVDNACLQAASILVG